MSDTAPDPSPKNVAVLLTPPGPAAIAVLRLSGDGVDRFLRERFSKPTTPGRCVHGLIRDESGNVLDDAVVVRLSDRDAADLNLHGGAWVVRSVMNLAERSGFAIREVADVPDVAFDVSSELEREVLSHLPLARTELALRTLLAQPTAWAEFLPSATQDELREVLADRSLYHLLHPPRVAIVGVPNVGKSTLANQLFAQERSITADIPGTTRDWVGEIANIDGLAVMLVDTPGVRETPDAIEREAIDRSRAEVTRADLVIVVLDPTQPIGPEQATLLAAHPDGIVVINKSDQAAAGAFTDLKTAVRITALTGQGVEQLREAIKNRFGCHNVQTNRVRAWTERQRTLIKQACIVGYRDALLPYIRDHWTPRMI